MSFKDVIEDLVYDKGLDQAKVLEIVTHGLAVAYKAKYPTYNFKVVLSKDMEAEFEVFAKKQVADEIVNPDVQINLKKALGINSAAKIDSEVLVPFAGSLGRVDILVARGAISEAIKRLEQDHVYQIFSKRVGELVTGTLHKQEFSGCAINLGEVIAFLPKSCTPPLNANSGAPIKAIIREVLQYTSKGYQVILDRASANYVAKIFELEIPEVFEGIVEIVKAERICGYKTKILVRSKAKNIDPVGSFVGIAGSRIKPILAELGTERIDLIPWTDDREALLRKSLKPGEVRRVSFSQDYSSADVWVAPEEKPLIIGKNGGNINLASRIMGLHIRVNDEDVLTQENSQEGGD